MPDWFVERGIGETRYACIVDDRLVEARIEVEGIVPAGTQLTGKLRRAGSHLIATVEGREYLLPKGAPGVPEGAAIDIVVTRSAIPGTEPWKRPIAKVAGLAEGPSGPSAMTPGRLPGSWDDLIEEARSGIIRFAGGELRISPTPAMTLIDVDGNLAPEDLAVTGAAEAAKAIRRLDIGGSIGIDLPTVAGKRPRLAIADAIDDVLPKPFERTAVNGFGFIQIVRPRHRASLIELAQDRAAFEARVLLRRASMESPGAKRLVAHPAVAAVLEGKPDWLDQLGRQIGGAVGLRLDPALPISGGYAEPA